MANFLKEKAWKEELKKHEGVKDTGVSEPLRDYAKYTEKDDQVRALQSLNLLVTKAEALQRVQKSNDKLKNYLKSMLDEAQKEVEKLKPIVKKLEKEKDGEGDEGGEGVDKLLRIALKRAMTKRMYFAIVAKSAAEGKLLVSKVKVPPADVADTKKALKGGKVFRGLCMGENGKLVFYLPKDPPPALARIVRKLIKAQAGLQLKVDCRNIKGLGEVGARPDDDDEGNAQRISAYQNAHKSWTSAMTVAQKSVQSLQQALTKTGDQQAAVVARKLSRIIDKMPQVDLAFTRLINASQGDNEDFVVAVQDEAKVHIDAALNYLKDPVLSLAEKNPFVKIDFRKPLGTAPLQAKKKCPGLK